MGYADNVFINCPFDAEFEFLRNAIVFVILDCGFTPRCALEAANGGHVRFDSIKKIIEDSRFGLHDISRTELDSVNGLPRFNMPLELGVFIGAGRYGGRLQKSKSTLILDTEQYRYQKFISDIAGQDIRAHENSESKVIACVRNWLMTESKRKDIPGGGHIFVRYARFKADLPAICKKTRIELTELTYPDYVTFAAEWVKVEPLDEGSHTDQDLS